MLADLVPPDVYGVMPDWLLWLFLAIALRFLAFGADRLVQGAVRLASVLGISTIVIGATVVSLGTTTPEAFVSVSAAFRGKPGLALGNGVGSIICDTALIFGLVVLIGRVPHDRFVLYRQGVMKLVVVALLIALVFAVAIAGGGIAGATIPRAAGVGLLVLLAAYMVLSVRWSRHKPEALAAGPEVAAEGDSAAAEHKGGVAVWDLLILVEGLAIVYVTSDLLIGSVSNLCIRYGVPPDVLAVTVVAFGTSLPELVTCVTAVLKGHGELAVGNVIGADILNVLFVVGASAAAVPLAVPDTFFYIHLPVMAVSVGLMGVYIFTTRGTFRRWQGVPLLAVFAAYYVILFVLVGQGVIKLQ